MSDDNSFNTPWMDDASEESYDPEEEAVDEGYPAGVYDPNWNDEDVSGVDVADPLEDGIDASFYEPPEPPVTDAELKPNEEAKDSGDWWRENWWRLAIIIILVMAIIVLLARSCSSRKKKTPAMPGIASTPTTAALPTFTPTLAPLPTQSLESGSEAPAGGGLEATPEATPAEAPAVQPTQPPAPAPTTAPATGGKFTIGQTVVVTGTGKDKLSFRAGPGTDYKRVGVIKDGVRLTVIGGPEKADGYTWWQLKTPKGYVGWAVEDYLAPEQ